MSKFSIDIGKISNINFWLCSVKDPAEVLNFTRNERNLFLLEFMIMPTVAATAGPSAVVTQPGITRGDTTTPTFQFVLRGTYQVDLTVTDRTGATSTSAVTVRCQ